MQLLIRKRTGELVPFDKEKIKTAIYKAYQEVYSLSTEWPYYVPEIADMVEGVAEVTRKHRH